ncbi:hypothetical protein F4801DRAFT_588256 [Xylaria longipes]|nr:hypothetical protein F4801DRAFT_588256 [Xylaria longipes]
MEVARRTEPSNALEVRIYPFYNQDRGYPPDACAVQVARKRVTEQPAEIELNVFPYTTVERLVHDTSSKNTYHYSIYASITGGGFGAKPLFFATDADENRRQRATFGQFLQAVGVITPGDWGLTVHSAGELYRSLDLTLEILEDAGASVLSTLLAKYHVNVLTGDSNQVIQIVHHISTLLREERDKINLDKIMYTSEMLTSAQRAYIGRPVRRLILLSPTLLPDGERGIVVQTSLTRLRNPLVRYVTGDVGSLHPLPDHVRTLLPETKWRHFRILRLTGRDRRFMQTRWTHLWGRRYEVRVLCVARDEDAISIQQAIADRITTFLHVYGMNDHRFWLKFAESIDGFERSDTGRRVIKFIDRYYNEQESAPIVNP